MSNRRWVAYGEDTNGSEANALFLWLVLGENGFAFEECLLEVGYAMVKRQEAFEEVYFIIDTVTLPS